MARSAPLSSGSRSAADLARAAAASCSECKLPSREKLAAEELDELTASAADMRYSPLN
jgi:hypothetical protein